jgi:hypothetical protein
VDELPPPVAVEDLVELLHAAAATSTAAPAASSFSLRLSIYVSLFVVADGQSLPRRAIEPCVHLSTHDLI